MRHLRILIVLAACAGGCGGSGSLCGDAAVAADHDAAGPGDAIRDSARSDGPSDATTDSVDAVATPYAQWWYPDCRTSTGACNLERCRAAKMAVSPLPCGRTEMVDAGCVPKDLPTLGWQCWVKG